MIVDKRLIPNYNHLIEFFVKKYGFWVKCGYFEELDKKPCRDYEINTYSLEYKGEFCCPKCGAYLIKSK